MKNFTLQRTEQFMNVLLSTIRQKAIRISDIDYQNGREDKGEWQKFPLNSYWGSNNSWTLFKTEFTIPQEYEGETVKCSLSTGRDGKWCATNPQMVLRINGKVKQALDTNHLIFTLSKNAKAGEKFLLEFEAYAGRSRNEQTFIDSPLQFNLSAYCYNEDSEQLFFDLKTAKMAAEIYGEENYIRIQIEEHLRKALNLLDCRVPSSEEYFASLKEARKYMQEEFYGKFCGHEDVIANCIGHTHIDVAWQWQLEQTRAKAVRSFSTELALMEDYPEHIFSSSQPQLYQFVKEDCPEVYEKIKQRVKEGRWEVEGAMWLEADCNLSSGESLIRQILHGKRFMQEEFGVDSKILWLPDVFGYSAALPQILKKSGVESFVTSKIHWSETNHFPYDTFMWKGIDGTEMFTQFITAAEPNAKLGDESFYSTYNAQIYPISLAKGWEIYQQKAINNETLVSFGYGDGGGGVTYEMLEMQRRMAKGIPGSPKTRITNAKDTLDRIKKNVEGKKIPKWFGELYLEYHRGTYTSMAKNKKYNRVSEFLLAHTETVSLADKLLLGGGYDKQEIYDSWTTVLLNQFHDIIPGSSIKEVYDDSDAQYEALIQENSQRAQKAVQNLAKNVSKEGIFVYNPSGTKASGIAEADGKKYFAKDVPALGWKVIDDKEEIKGKLSVSKTAMENDFFKIEIDEKGTLTSIYDKRYDREVLSGRANVLEAFDDHPRAYDNWEICNYHQEIKWEIDDVSAIETEIDALSATVKIKRKFLSSELVQKITIYRDIERIDFDIDADWREHHIFVKTAFPVDIMSDKATYEIQYGAVERPAHMNTSWDEAKFEVCAHKWADFGEAGYGVALMNDCKYGYDIHDGIMRLSLIKCGTEPNPVADIGNHKIRYSLMPHGGTWREANVTNEAYAFNCPLVAEKTQGGGALPAEFSAASADKDNIIISVVKEACDSEDIIIRAYESQGIRTKANIACGLGISAAWEVDMLEKEVYADLDAKDGKVALMFKPYEIKTIKIKK